MRMFALLFVLFVTSLPAVAVDAGSASLLGGYVPGQPNSFVFQLPPVSNLGSYNIELFLTSPTGVAGRDFFFDVAATMPASAAYVFPNSGNFFAAANSLPGNRHSLTLSDFTAAGTDVVAGVNDGVAMVVFNTLPGFNGALSLSLGQDSFQLDTPATTPTPVANFAAAIALATSSVEVTVTPVPEAAPMGLIGIALAFLGTHRIIGSTRVVQSSRYLVSVPRTAGI